MIRILLVDDQAIIRAGLRSIIDGEQDISVIAEAGHGREGIHAAGIHLPDVVMMDLRMPVMDGIMATRSIREDPRLADVRILVLTTFDGDPEALAAIGAGADGFLSKAAGPDDLINAIRTVAGGAVSLPQHALRAVLGVVRERDSDIHTQPVDPVLADRLTMLTDREREVVIAAAMGRDNEGIAGRLFISPFTVKTHLNRAMMKLDARDRGQLVAIAHISGLVNQG